MEHQKIKELISSYYDGELDEENKRTLKRHLEECPECRKEFEEMGKLEEAMSKMELKEPPKEIWASSAEIQSGPVIWDVIFPLFCGT